MSKTVSTVMCTYNGEAYLREQLDSIVNQTYPIHELIIQDDCSTDGTIGIVKEYMEKYPYIKLYANEHNLGFNLNFKSAVMKATGDFVAISDQDDVWVPEKLEKQVEAIRDHSICCSFYKYGKDIDTARTIQKKIGFERVLFSSIYGHTMLCKTAFIQDERNWLPPIWYDWSLAIFAYLNDGVCIVELPLSWHRIHSGEVTWTTHIYKQLSYQPYVFGLKRYLAMQKDENWQFVYTYIFNHTDIHSAPLVHRLSQLLLKKDMLSIFRLCCLCLKHRDKIYPQTLPGGLMGRVRSFFYPFIYAYPPTTLYKKCN